MDTDLDMDMDTDIQLSPSDWVYKGEGNMNIVLSYTGSHQHLIGKVLRLKKTTDSSDIHPVSIEHELFFTSSVIKPLLGSEYVGDVILIPITPSFLTTITSQITPSRPTSRTHKHIDLSQPHAVLCLDYTQIPIIPTTTTKSNHLTIELKPKAGFKPTHNRPDLVTQFLARHNSHQNNNKDLESLKSHLQPSHLKYLSCRYCMHQYLKHQNGKISVKSGYCPLDLYSGDSVRIHKAISNMWTWRQNNLKVFYNGVVVKGEEDETNVLNAFLGSESSNESKEIVINLLTKIMAREPLLRRLKLLQKTLDRIGIEELYHLYKTQFEDSNSPDGMFSTEEEISEWKGIVKTCLENLRDDGVKSEESKEYSVKRLIKEFLVSATLKDCSVMISMVRCGSEEDARRVVGGNKSGSSHLIKLGGEDDDSWIVYSVHVVDLDPKSVSKIPKYYELEQEIERVVWGVVESSIPSINSTTSSNMNPTGAMTTSNTNDHPPPSLPSPTIPICLE